MKKFGHKDVKAISNFVGTRNSTQVRTHAQKYYLRLNRLKEQGVGDDEDDDLDQPGDTSPAQHVPTPMPASMILSVGAIPSMGHVGLDEQPFFKRQRQNTDE